MKKLLSLGFADIIWSVLPIIFWYLTGILWGSDYRNGFIIGYSFQFVNVMLREMFILGSLKSQISDENKRNHFGMGFICYFVISISLCAMLSLFGSKILSVFGYDGVINQGLYKIYAWQFTIDGIVMGINSYFQYQEKRKLSHIISYFYFGLKLISLFVCWNVYKNDCLHALCMCNVFLLIVSIILALVCIDFKNLTLDVKNWVSREGYGISSHFVMFIIYFFGVGDMSSDIVFLTAYNMSTICSDIHWDLENSIDTYSAIEAATGEWNEKKRKVFWNVTGYSTLLFLSSMIMVLLSGNRMAFFIWLIEMSLYIPDCIGSYFLAYASVKRPSKGMWILGFGDKILRLLTQVLIISLWGIPIACFVGCFVFCIGSVMLYYRAIKQQAYNDLKTCPACDIIKI